MALNLKAKVTTQRDRDAIAWLKTQTDIPENLIHEMFTAKTKQAVDSLEDVLRSDFKWFDLNGKRLSIAQLEIVNTDDLIKNHLDRILATLDELKKEYNVDYIFLTDADVEGNYNVFVTKDAATQELLEKVFEISFNNGVTAKHDGLILRKEIMPLLKEELE